MKKTFLLVWLMIALLLTSCSPGDSDRDRIKAIFKMNDREMANGCFEKVIDAIQKRDAEALKALFSVSAQKEAENLEDSIRELFEYYQGEMVSYKDWASPNTKTGMNTDNRGHYWKKLYATYDVETTQEPYRFAMEYIALDTDDENSTGIRSLYVIKLKEDTNPHRAYRGDGEYTPGIQLRKTKPKVPED